MYSFNSRIRYSESDCEGKLSMTSLLNYFQDASTFQSEDLGVGVKYMEKNRRAWVLSSWQIVVNRFPEMGEEVVIGTFPYDFKGFLGYRNFVMQTPCGEQLAVANTLWSHLDLCTGKPASPAEEIVNKYPQRERLAMDYAPRKIIIPEGGKQEESIIVKKYHLDTNHHVNNVQFVDMAMAFLPEHFVIRQLRVEYKMQAFLNDILYPYIVSNNEKIVVNLTDADGKTYVSVEFLRKEM